MRLDAQRVRQCLKDGDFKRLFIEELGWDHQNATLDVAVDGQTFTLNVIAEKRGMVAFHCDALPDYPMRRKIEREVAKSAHEHIIIYTDAARTTQIWQWVKREAGKPTACREHHYHRNQPGDALIQKLQAIAFSFEEEEALTLFDVTTCVRAGFDVERVTRRFYDRFKTEHAAFLKFLEGIPDEEMQRWYVSVMLNRLMFIYFVQKKGFLDGDENYLRNKLNAYSSLIADAAGRERTPCRSSDDEDSMSEVVCSVVAERSDIESSSSEERHGVRSLPHTPSFYKDFLCPLFFEGFAKKESERSDETNRLLGKVPYLNGGIFQRHQIEELHGEQIQIPDAAFERLFAFFEQYHWHLDERPLRADNEINPDVLGYIFEKYINQKQMGAYYTKEDITEYISKNTIIPFLFDAARQKCRIAFESEHSVWGLLQSDPDRYIYDAVKKGVDLPLPEEIAAGLNDVSQRIEWNRPAPPDYALPTEIWREVVARRKRYDELIRELTRMDTNEKLVEIRGDSRMNDLVTCNLNIRQFAQDVIENCEGPELLRAFWDAIQHVRVLDPTCGSGAFLFAALNVLEPLYEACLDRMEAFVADYDRAQSRAVSPSPPSLQEPKQAGTETLPYSRRKFSDFRAVLERIRQHPNRRYFVLKSIIVNNLFGVDIMEEAVEICKLRLFLKLVAQVERVEDIEPLPDIDFNIRAGNTLVGYATYDEVKRAITPESGGQSKMQFDDTMQRIEVKAADLQQAFDAFRKRQTEGDGSVPTKDKLEVYRRLDELERELNRYLAEEYQTGLSTNPKAYDQWLRSHKPFHWFIEFYGIIKSGGFDVIIGNPPFVEYSKVRKDYIIRGYATESCGNLYAFVMERVLNLLNKSGSTGFILPISLVCTQRMEALQNSMLATSQFVWLGNYAERPSKLFVGAEVLLTIMLARAGKRNESRVFTTGFTKWSSDERETLFDRTTYSPCKTKIKPYVMPKLSATIEASILKRIAAQKGALSRYLRTDTKFPIYYRIGGGRYWKVFTNFQPRFILNGKSSVSSRENYLYFESATLRDAVISVLSSSLFYWYFILTTNCRDLNPSDLQEFPMNLERLSPERLAALSDLCKSLMADYKEKSQLKEKTSTLTGHIVYQEFYPRLSKHILDEIDRALAAHYRFTEEELDFIINYDIKYRMGREAGEEDSNQ